jgi:hypothetical protein
MLLLKYNNKNRGEYCSEVPYCSQCCISIFHNEKFNVIICKGCKRHLKLYFKIFLSNNIICKEFVK